MKVIPSWYDEHAELVRFAAILNEVGLFLDETAIMLEYFEKPWKWSNEHARWVMLGRPAASDIPNASDLQEGA